MDARQDDTVAHDAPRMTPGRDTGPESARIKSDIDRTRAELDETVSALQERLSPGRLAGDLLDTVAGGTSNVSHRIIDGIRHNPIPAALIGAGITWLIINRSSGRGGHSTRADGRDRPERGGYGDRDWLAPGAEYTPGSAEWAEQREPERARGRGRGVLAGTGRAIGQTVSGAVGGAVDTARSAASGVANKAADLAHGATSAIGSAAGSVTHGLSDASHYARERARRLREQAARTAGRAKTGFWETFEEYPLAVGGGLLALGIIAGLSIPPTRRESKLMGRKRDELLARAKGAGRDVLESSKHVARETASAAQNEAQRQDLRPGDIVDKAKRVVSAAVHTATEETGRVAGDAVGRGRQNKDQGQDIE